MIQPTFKRGNDFMGLNRQALGGDGFAAGDVLRVLVAPIGVECHTVVDERALLPAGTRASPVPEGLSGITHRAVARAW